MSALWHAGCWMLLGSTTVWVFLGQSLVAVALLEVINYIEHYGLRRQVELIDRDMKG